MSVALVVFYLVKRGVEASPIPAQSFQSSLPLTSCDDLHSCRTIWNIVRSCLATIFSCVWVAFHPGIPKASEDRLAAGIKRLETTVLALFAPEDTIARALAEYITASYLATIYKERGWTKTHGFFVVMGGFELYRGDERIRTLDWQEFEILVDRGEINFPTITEKEINDKSKGDDISKGIVFFQTGWFILQCVARWVAHLPITELEIATLGFALLNLIIYLLWWNKPLNVHCPVRVLMIPSEQEDSRSLGSLGTHPVRIPEQQDLMFTRGEEEMSDHTEEVEEMTIHAEEKEEATSEYTKKDEESRSLRKLRDIFLDALVFMLVAIVFGAIHCIAWSFHFPSQAEQFLWRISSVVTTCLPLGYTFVIFIFALADWRFKLVSAAYTFTVLYFLARIPLLVIPFTSLRSLPLGAYQIVQWTNFIPHI